MRDRGSAAIEAAIVFPGLALVAMLIYAGTTTMTADSQVQGAARAAARAAAVADSAGDARARAEAATAAALSTGSTCAGSASTSVSGFAAGGVVTVTVSCQSDPIFPIVVGPRTMTGTASEAVSGLRGGLD